MYIYIYICTENFKTFFGLFECIWRLETTDMFFVDYIAYICRSNVNNIHWRYNIDV